MDTEQELRQQIARLIVCRCTNCYQPLPGFNVHGPGWHWVTPNLGPFCKECFDELCKAR